MLTIMYIPYANIRLVKPLIVRNTFVFILTFFSKVFKCEKTFTKYFCKW